jgi:hypothetical protein
VSEVVKSGDTIIENNDKEHCGHDGKYNLFNKALLKRKYMS